MDELLEEDVHRIHLADREADIFDFVAARRCSNSDLLICATHNRALQEGGLLWEHVAALASSSKTRQVRQDDEAGQ